MHESSLIYLRCVKCNHALDLDIFEKKDEIIEGLLSCCNCNNAYPIILSIPFLIEDLSIYFSIRTKLGGYLLLQAKNSKIRSMIKRSLQKISKVGDDTTDLEKNWVGIYKNSQNSLFKKTIKNIISNLPRCPLVIEHGCSIGAISEILSKYHGHVFGVDKSFFALLEAKKRKIKNSDFILADSLQHPFGKQKFGLIVALNVLEIIEPFEMLDVINSQTKKFVILSDPYDYERGKNSVKVKLDAKTLRTKLSKMGLKLIHNTNRPSFISWKLCVNPRLDLNYKVDLIVGEK